MILNAITIQDLMMVMCTAKFDIEEKELVFINQFLTKEESEAGNEETDAQAKETLDLIRDNKEDDIVPTQEQPTTQGVS